MSPTIPNETRLPPETLLKKRKNADRQRVQKQQAASDRKNKLGTNNKRSLVFKRAEKFIKEYRDIEREENRVSKVIDNIERLDVPSQAKLVFVVRIKSQTKIAPKARKVLQLLRLSETDSGIFLKLTKSSAELLKIVEPYVAYGYPNLASVRKLIYKRGYAKVSNTERTPLTDNQMVENALGEYGIICLEDLIHEIYTMGPNFKVSTNFLWPFKLSTANAGLGVRQKIKKFVEREGLAEGVDDINALIDAQN